MANTTYRSELEALEAFTEYVDINLEPVNIHGFAQFDTSQILRALDPDMWHSMFLDWCDQHDIDLDELPVDKG